MQRGLIQKRKIYNDTPMRHRRDGLQHAQAARSTTSACARRSTLLLNRDELIKKLFFNEYVPMNSYYAGGIYENPNNPKNLYDQQACARAARGSRLEGPRRARAGS